jgi:hypothetical protein
MSATMGHPARPPAAAGNHHQRGRAAIAPDVNAGKATCARRHEPINAGEEWHLDHDDSRSGYLGPSHARCNLSAAAAVTNGRRIAQPTDEMPYRWSQRWHDDPPIGTVVLGHERVIYLGNGEWQPLADKPNL